jgi:uncharacterized membrane protein HdeD (DUF308 family)
MADGKVLGLDFNDKAVQWSVAISVLLIVLGLIALFAPFFAGEVLVSVIGWVLIVVGCTHFWAAWHIRGKGAEVWEVLIGVAYIVAGVLLMRHPLVGLVSLTAILAIYLLFKGLFDLARALRRRPAKGSGWMFLEAVISLLLAVVIGWHLLSTSTWVIGTLVGFVILLSGIARLAVTWLTQKEEPVAP